MAAHHAVSKFVAHSSVLGTVAIAQAQPPCPFFVRIWHIRLTVGAGPLHGRVRLDVQGRTTHRLSADQRLHLS
jgi:hypothetical protein